MLAHASGAPWDTGIAALEARVVAIKAHVARVVARCDWTSPVNDILFAVAVCEYEVIGVIGKGAQNLSSTPPASALYFCKHAVAFAEFL